MESSINRKGRQAESGGTARREAGSVAGMGSHCSIGTAERQAMLFGKRRDDTRREACPRNPDRHDKLAEFGKASVPPKRFEQGLLRCEGNDGGTGSLAYLQRV